MHVISTQCLSVFILVFLSKKNQDFTINKLAQAIASKQLEVTYYVQKSTKCDELHETCTVNTYFHDLWFKNEGRYRLFSIIFSII